MNEYLFFNTLPLGAYGFSNMDVFLEKFRRGGSFPIQKNYIADFFGFKTIYFGRKFWKKCPKRGETGGVISNPKNFTLKIYAYLRIFAKKRNVISKRGGRGGGSSPIQKNSLQINKQVNEYLRIFAKKSAI